MAPEGKPYLGPLPLRAVVLDPCGLELGVLRALGLVPLSLRFLVLLGGNWLGLVLGFGMGTRMGSLDLYSGLRRLVCSGILRLVVVASLQPL